MSRYQPIPLPPQEPSVVWACADCGAMVTDRQLHDTAVHGDWTATDHAPDSTLPSATIPPRRYAP